MIHLLTTLQRKKCHYLPTWFRMESCFFTLWEWKNCVFLQVLGSISFSVATTSTLIQTATSEKVYCSSALSGVPAIIHCPPWRFLYHSQNNCSKAQIGWPFYNTLLWNTLQLPVACWRMYRCLASKSLCRASLAPVCPLDSTQAAARIFRTCHILSSFTSCLCSFLSSDLLFPLICTSCPSGLSSHTKLQAFLMTFSRFSLLHPTDRSNH